MTPCPRCAELVRENEAVKSERDILLRHRERLAVNVVKLIETYVSMVNSGDCGHWDPENDDPIIEGRKAMAALSLAPAQPEACPRCGGRGWTAVETREICSADEGGCVPRAWEDEPIGGCVICRFHVGHDARCPKAEAGKCGECGGTRRVQVHDPIGMAFKECPKCQPPDKEAA